MVSLEEILRKIAIDICENKCGGGGCPCKEGCDVYSDEDCINRIMNYFKFFIVDSISIPIGQSIEYEAEWKYWSGWSGNHDKRIDDATCSKCGYKHPTIRFGTPDLLQDYCPSCKSRMKKR